MGVFCPEPYKSRLSVFLGNYFRAAYEQESSNFHFFSDSVRIGVCFRVRTIEQCFFNDLFGKGLICSNYFM